MDEPEADVEPALHAARVAADDPVGRVGDAEQLEQLVDALAQPAPAHALHAPLQRQVLAAGRRRVDARLLRHVADRAANGVGLADDVVARDLGPPVVRAGQRRKHAHGRRLARAVRPEQAEDLALAHAERNAVERLHLRRSASASPSTTIASTRRAYERAAATAVESPGPVDLYEYQGKELFRRFGIPVSEGRLATTPEEARAAAEELGGQVVVKAQVLDRRPRQGGRDQARRRRPTTPSRSAGEILGLDIRGHVVRKLWIEQRLRHREGVLPLAHVRPRRRRSRCSCSRPRAASRSRRSRRRSPTRSSRLHVDPLEGFQPYQARRLIYGAGIDDPSEQKQIARHRRASSTRFVESDAMLCEINPLIVTPDGEVRALDSKFTVDDNALFRHPDIAEMRDPDAVSARGARRAREGRHVREARRRGRHPRQRRRARRCRRST